MIDLASSRSPSRHKFVEPQPPPLPSIYLNGGVQEDMYLLESVARPAPPPPAPPSTPVVKHHPAGRVTQGMADPKSASKIKYSFAY